MDDRYLPSIEQIIEKGDSLGDRPMSDIESQWWFEETCRRNREFGQSGEAEEGRR